MPSEDGGQPPAKPNHKRQYRITEISAIVSQFKMLTTVQNMGVGEACKVIAEEYGRSKDSVYTLIRRFMPSVDGAEAYIKSNALKLAMRVVRKANVDQSIDILSRSNVGVLAPKQDGGGGQGGFFLSVTADTCGAVKITAGATPALGPQRYADLPQPLDIEQAPGVMEDKGQFSPSSSLRDDSGSKGATDNELCDDERSEEEHKRLMTTPGVPHPHQGSFGRFQRSPEEWGKRHQLELDRHKQRLTEARRAAALAPYKDVEV